MLGQEKADRRAAAQVVVRHLLRERRGSSPRQRAKAAWSRTSHSSVTTVSTTQQSAMIRVLTSAAGRRAVTAVALMAHHRDQAVRRQERAVPAIVPDDVLAHQLAVGELMQRLQGLRRDAGIVGGQAGGGAQQDVGRVVAVELAADAAILPDLAGDPVDEIGDVCAYCPTFGCMAAAPWLAGASILLHSNAQLALTARIAPHIDAKGSANVARRSRSRPPTRRMTTRATTS